MGIGGGREEIVVVGGRRSVSQHFKSKVLSEQITSRRKIKRWKEDKKGKGKGEKQDVLTVGLLQMDTWQLMLLR